MGQVVDDGAQPAGEHSPAGQDAGFWGNNPFVSLLGFVVRRCAQGEAVVDYVPADVHLNSFAVTHGGALMTLLDVTMAAAARSVWDGMAVVTVEMKTSFMQPAQAQHSPLTATATLIHRTATMAFTQATVVDKQGRACAHATGTFKYIKRLPL